MKWAFLGKCLVRCKSFGQASWVALASVAQSLLGLRNHLVQDIGRLKEAGLKRVEAESANQAAKARKEEAEAMNAANSVTDVEHEKAKRALELEKMAIQNRKLEAEAAASEAKTGKARAEALKAGAQAMEEMLNLADEMRARGIELAEQELHQALRQFTLEGGALFIDPNILKALSKPTARTGKPLKKPKSK